MSLHKDTELFRVSTDGDGFLIQTSSDLNYLSLSQIEFLFYHILNLSSASIVDGSSIELIKNGHIFARSISDQLHN